MYNLGNINVIVKRNYDEMCLHCSQIFAGEIQKNPNIVLGLATGGTPVGVYRYLVDLYKNGSLSFAGVTAFNLDEYYPIKSTDVQSYHYFMHDNLFNHVDIDLSNTHLPDGETDDAQRECMRYEDAIAAAGGIDLQLLGIGLNGHIGFNEPSSFFTGQTSVSNLTESTIQANSRYFDSFDDVPKMGISMGIKTIMMARKVVLIANGEHKSEIIKNALLGPVTPSLPASALQLHQNVTVILDSPAAQDFVDTYNSIRK